ncbi:ankyrin repeat-containing domain protein [Fusarium venenatum]|uniref:ankyrin repeat-containing domain protein n=1 Tax=Fusarium venenatum TaxID=56646 RepID=UPI001D31ACFA|nr:ankyrin repeat-containing domain protein [Fusarium venenatum]
MSSARQPTEPAYEKFSHAPIKYYEGHIPNVPVTMTGPDGTILYENGARGLFREIMCRDDVDSLKQYLAIDPWMIGGEDYDGPDYYSVFHFAHERGSHGVLRFLLSHQETVPECVSYRKEMWSLLNEAAHKADVDFVRFLLDNQPPYADIHGRDTFGCTPILEAASIWPGGYGEVDTREPSVEKSEAVMNLLLDRGASASDVAVHPERTTHTVLTSAVRWASPELVKRLIDGGADVHAKVTGRRLGLDYEPVSDMTAISFAMFHANVNVIQTLFDCRGSGVDIRDMVSSRDSSGSHPLHWVNRSYMSFAQKPYMLEAEQTQMIEDIIKIMNILLDIDPSAINMQDSLGNTALHYATQHPARDYKQYNAILELLCSKGADASIRNNRKETPLHTILGHAFTADKADIQAMGILCDHGASVMDTDENGNSPLHLALAEMSPADVVSFLLEQGADPNLMNMKHNTPLHLAISYPYHGQESRKKQDDIIGMVSKVAGNAGVKILQNGDGKTAQQLLLEQKKLREEDDIQWLELRKPRAW